MNALLFALTALLWGGGALATALQAGVTPAAWSVALRMAPAKNSTPCSTMNGRSRGGMNSRSPRQRP